MKNFDYSLYLCTDSQLMTTKTVEESVEAAIKGGVTMVQLREKSLSSRMFYERALLVKAVTDHYGIPLIINDRLDIALAVQAEGLHIGQSDLPIEVVRSILGPDKVIGISAGNSQEALEAEKNGADYLGVGAMYATHTKKDAQVTSMEELKKIRREVRIPIVAIGGIQKERIKDFEGIDIEGFAVVSAIVGQDHIEEAARDLKDTIKKFLWNQEVRR